MKYIPYVVIAILLILLLYKRTPETKYINKVDTKTIYKKNDSLIYIIKKKREYIYKELDSIEKEVTSKVDTSKAFVNYINERYQVETAQTIEDTLREKISNELIQKDVAIGQLKVVKNHLALETNKSTILSNQIGLLNTDIENMEFLAKEREKQLKRKHRRNVLIGVGVGIIKGVLIANYIKK